VCAREPEPESDSKNPYFTDGSNLYRFVGWLTGSGDAGLAALEDCRSLGVLLVSADDLAKARLRPVTSQRP